MANKTETIPAERWKQAAENLKKIVPAVSNIIIKSSGSKEAAEDFSADMFLAFTALEYVSRYAADDCKFIIEDN